MTRNYERYCLPSTSKELLAYYAVLSEVGSTGQIPKGIVIHGEEYRISAATKRGVPLGDAEYNIDYLTDMQLDTILVNLGEEYYVYARAR